MNIGCMFEKKLYQIHMRRVSAFLLTEQAVQNGQFGEFSVEVLVLNR
ncbi:MAG: hypothetical protein ACI90V_010935 [Bacillariaceae sp.]|jgi:hypothetical protein